MYSISPPVPNAGSSEDSPISQLLLALAKRRNPDNGPTGDVQAAFKEGERAPVAGASA